MAAADSGRPPYVAADVRFMQGMITHHAQALVMSALAPARAAGNDVRVLAERIAVAQRDEIRLMQRWLRDRGEPVPDTTHVMMGHAMAAGDLMAGMLSAPQLDSLRAARGAEFDRRFLISMIQHHEGALVMVRALFGSQGAAQDGDIFRFASDVDADQNTEIDRMRRMLAARLDDPPPPSASARLH
ncbi:MAG: DUF305 domain-containing protein [Gemmatimonadaceae bacterium]